MSVYKEGANWQNRILNHYPPAPDGERYYRLVDAAGNVIQQAVKLELLNTVLPGNEGTPANAENFNTMLAAMGTATKNYNSAKVVAPYRDSALVITDFTDLTTPQLGEFTLTATGTTQVAGAHTGSNGRQGSGATSGLTANRRLVPIGARTIRFWLKPTAATAQTILDETNNNAANYGTTITMTAAYVVNVKVFSGGTTCININSAALTVNAWNHVVFAWDGTTKANRVRIYVNGTLSAQATCSNLPAAVEPSYDTVLLNNAPITTANAGGTAVISELEIYEEAIYCDAYVLTQKGFSLFDGAKVRIKWGTTLATNVEPLLNINDSGNVPVITGATNANDWQELVYNGTTKTFEHLQQSDAIPVSVSNMSASLPGRKQTVNDALSLLSRLHYQLLMDNYWSYGSVSGNGAIAAYNQTTTTLNVGQSGSKNWGLYYSATVTKNAAGQYVLNNPQTKSGTSWTGLATSANLTIMKNNYFWIQKSGSTIDHTAQSTAARSYFYKATSASVYDTTTDTNSYTLSNVSQVYFFTSPQSLAVNGYLNASGTTRPSGGSGTYWGPWKIGTMARITIGTYDGTGTTTKTFSLGTNAKIWMPIMVKYRNSQNHYSYNNYTCHGGVLLQNLPQTRYSSYPEYNGPQGGKGDGGNNLTDYTWNNGTLTITGTAANNAYNATGYTYTYMVIY